MRGKDCSWLLDIEAFLLFVKKSQSILRNCYDFNLRDNTFNIVYILNQDSTSDTTSSSISKAKNERNMTSFGRGHIFNSLSD